MIFVFALFYLVTLTFVINKFLAEVFLLILRYIGFLLFN